MAESANNDQAQKIKLLVLDDEADLCDLVSSVAIQCGFDTHTSSDVTEFPVLYSTDIDVIVLDLIMPGIDGIEIIRFLADNKSRCQLILMSGFDRHVLDSARKIAEGRGLNVLGCLTKPFTTKDLHDIFDQIERHPSAAAHFQACKPHHPTNISLDDLEQAINTQQIIPFYQPQIEVKSQKVIGVEALARWITDDGLMIPPLYFIPLAEENGLISRITEMMLLQVLDQIERWQDKGWNLKVSINVSPKDLTDLEYPEHFISLIEQKGLRPGSIVMEVTESCVVDELVNSLDILTRLRIKGINLSIDDFGTGYSSMRQLKHFPFTELKVDQSFVAEALTSPDSFAILEASVNLGHKLEMEVVAEGVETQADLNLLQTINCDIAQGYYIGRPMDEDHFARWYIQWNSQRDNIILNRFA